MEMVAASRMKRAQVAVLAGRPYAEKLAEVISNLTVRLQASGDDQSHPLLQNRPIKSIAVIMVSADKGLAGALNTNIIRRTTRFVLGQNDVTVNMITVGRKGRDFMLRYGRPLVAEFTNIGDRPTIVDVRPIARVATEEFISGRADAVYLIYTDFVNTLIQRPNVYKLLPADVSATGDEGAAPGENRAGGGTVVDYEYEPGTAEVLSQLVPRYVEVRIYQALLEHLASEHSARMVAMRNATQSAKDMINDLTLAYNKLRQANITREIIEVSSGASALTG